MPYPLARDDDTKPQPAAAQPTSRCAVLAAEVDARAQGHRRAKVVLIGNSRGGNAIRNYIQNGGGANKVSHAILGGTPNHGVWADQPFGPNNEFNGAGPFLTALNAPKGADGDEVTPGVRWMTIRSDNNDKFAQPDGVWIGAKGTPTNVTLRRAGAQGRDKRGAARQRSPRDVVPRRGLRAGLSLHHRPAPATLAIAPEARVVLDGMVSGLGRTPGGTSPPTCRWKAPRSRCIATDADSGERRGRRCTARRSAPMAAGGRLPPTPSTPLEFVISAPGYATTHIYRSPFRALVEHRAPAAERLADADRSAGAVVTLTRPRGYFGAAARPHRASTASARRRASPRRGRRVQSKLKLAAAPRGRWWPTTIGRPMSASSAAWPAAENRVATLELTN